MSSELPVTQRRSAGALVPVFSIRSASDWGVGGMAELAGLGPLLERGGFRVLMVLPLLEPSPGQESPYSPVSAFALDPLYVSIDEVRDFEALGGRQALSDDDRATLARARGALSVRHDLVRPLKQKHLARCAERFFDAGEPERREDFERFRESAAWLGEYALFRALKEQHPESWRAWPEPLREHRELDAVKAQLSERIRTLEYVQWVAFRQLEDARRALADHRVSLGGDEPFLTAEDSADVWSRQDLYRFDATVGAPPDAFSETGQDWGLPPYAWDRIREEGYALFRSRGEHAARLFDLTRIDHVVGLYRTYHRPLEGDGGWFVPEHEPEQRAQGEAVLAAFGEGGAALIAEDLGVIPDFVRESLDRMQIPGFRVMRWEERDGRYRLPHEWPEVSVATNGTHDTETTAAWWESLPPHEREKLYAFEPLGALPREVTTTYNRFVHAAMLETLYGSRSNLAIFPVQDLFALRERINVPNTVGPHNWSWRLPWSLEAMASEDHVLAQLDALQERARRTGRL